MSGVIVDCHGHFTTEPADLRDFRQSQLDYAVGSGSKPVDYPGVPREELASIIAENQLALQKQRGTDVTLLSPRASAMGHHVPDVEVARSWARASNDTIADVCDLFPHDFVGVCQLPQTEGGDLGPAIDELRRCVDAGFVACNVNPDPSGGRWTSPPVTDPYWEPLWAALEQLEVPAMIHVSGSCVPAVQTTGAHYLAADTIVFMQLIQGDLFEHHPTLRLVIPHGGGAVPYHWGRFRGLAAALKRPPLAEHLMRNVSFDTCVYHQAGIDLLFEVVDHSDILFGSELLGAVKTDDPETGFGFDDTLRYIDRLDLDEVDRDAVLGGNARSVYPRLDALLMSQGR